MVQVAVTSFQEREVAGIKPGPQQRREGVSLTPLSAGVRPNRKTALRAFPATLLPSVATRTTKRSTGLNLPRAEVSEGEQRQGVGVDAQG